MIRRLSLVLDEKGYRSLTLMEDKAINIDNFTINNFEGSEQIREHFKDKITPFLKQNQNYLDFIFNNGGKKSRGRIVILEESKDELIERRVLYKKHTVAFPIMVNDKKTMQRFVQMQKITYNEQAFRNLISPFLEKEIKYADFKLASRVNLIKKELKRDKKNFYDILRLISKAYEIERKQRKELKTIESIYNEHLKTKKSDKSIRNIHLENDTERLFNINGIKYTPDEIPFDLDDLAKMETEFIPDGLGKRK